jgi:hypothetical protein
MKSRPVKASTIHREKSGLSVEASTLFYTELEFLNSLWGLGTEEE